MAGVVHPTEIHLTHTTEYIMMGALFVAVLIAIYFAQKMYTNRPETEFTGIGKSMADKWYFDQLYQMAIVTPLIQLGDILYTYMEKAGLQKFISGIGILSNKQASYIRTLQNGNVGFYIVCMVIGFIASIGIFFIGTLLK